MAKKRSTSRKKTSARRQKVDATDKQLVIVESPSKARTINKYLGDDYVVLASVGHVRDLPRKKAKGDKSPVPAIALDRDFEPHYEVLADKKSTVAELRKAAKQAREVWFATDLDREGEAIAWHLAEVLGVNPETAKRVIFSAITRTEIKHAFDNPRPIDMDRVNAQQARRILDRIVGYQVSPLLWKKVARGLSAGRVQSVAMRLVVDREREIRAFVPDESWQIHAAFQPGDVDLGALVASWQELNARRDDKGKAPARKELNAWLAEQGGLRGELVQVGGEKFELVGRADPENPAAEPADLTGRVRDIVALAGLDDIRVETEEDERGRGPARFRHSITGRIDPAVSWKVVGIETKRTKARATAPSSPRACRLQPRPGSGSRPAAPCVPRNRSTRASRSPARVPSA
jgi:DNA topoisomerase-1